MQLTFWNGVDSVGGVQILLSGGRGGLLFDLGVVSNPAIAPQVALFNDFVRPRGYPLPDYLRAGMAPLVEGLYAPRRAPGGDPVRAYPPLTAELPVVSRGDIDEFAVFVSHLHDDHACLLPFVAADVPVFMAAESQAMLGALISATELEAVQATVRGVPDTGVFTVGDLHCEVVSIDHDIVGAAGFIAQTPTGTIAYTGDWRYHGGTPKLVDRFIERCQVADVDALITEGSTVGSGPHRAQLSEPELIERVDRLVGECSGLVTIGYYPRNIERIQVLAEVARSRGRTLVVSPQTARILRQVADTSVVDLPVDREIGVLVGDDSASDVPALPLAVTVEQVRADRDGFVCEMQPDLWYRFLDLGVGPPDLYIHANGAPFGPGDPAWKSLETWVRMLGVKFQVLDSHGHALPHDLKRFMTEVRPDTVIPVHSNNPGGFPKGSHRTVVPQRGGRLEFAFS